MRRGGDICFRVCIRLLALFKFCESILRSRYFVGITGIKFLWWGSRMGGWTLCIRESVGEILGYRG